MGNLAGKAMEEGREANLKVNLNQRTEATLTPVAAGASRWGIKARHAKSKVRQER